MNSPHTISPRHTDQTGAAKSFKQALAATLIACSLLFTVGGPALTAQQGPAEKGPGSALCRYIPQLCGGW
ncbi:hypothetical protein IEE91_02745 [Kocuria sp. cx-455]|uniref:hypothetical protein n=1 Tax=unclassified Candidatus Sulfotelmatobacter TaxID=2635724 RepID=UPI001689C14A|nr:MULTISPECIES: hypothetical protein [unclassified Candidatus Sulfotelmatobacter]MBD2761598.1 hypothetical protein [Kocuria sp. cx-116]MBD2764127.1 hypothetical protein [Kocuria sp. cx-455]